MGRDDASDRSHSRSRSPANDPRDANATHAHTWPTAADVHTHVRSRDPDARPPPPPMRADGGNGSALSAAAPSGEVRAAAPPPRVGPERKRPREAERTAGGGAPEAIGLPPLVGGHGRVGAASGGASALDAAAQAFVPSALSAAAPAFVPCGCNGQSVWPGGSATAVSGWACQRVGVAPPAPAPLWSRVPRCPAEHVGPAGESVARRIRGGSNRYVFICNACFRCFDQLRPNLLSDGADRHAQWRDDLRPPPPPPPPAPPPPPPPRVRQQRCSAVQPSGSGRSTWLRLGLGLGLGRGLGLEG